MSDRILSVNLADDQIDEAREVIENALDEAGILYVLEED